MGSVLIVCTVVLIGCDTLAGRTLGPLTCRESYGIQVDSLGAPDTLAIVRYCTAAP